MVLVSSASLSCSSLDELEASPSSPSCIKTPVAEMPEPAAFAPLYQRYHKNYTIYGATVIKVIYKASGVT